MKKFIIILIVFIAMTIKTNAQIPNNGFENWTTVGSYQNPTGWATMNSYATGPFYSCTKSTDHYPASVGNYSIKLVNNTSLTQLTGGWGMSITKAFDYPYKPAFPIVGHPNSLCGYYKFTSLNNDSLFIRIIFFKNGIMGNYFTFYSGITTSTWTSFTLPLTYTSADSATIMMGALSLSSPTAGPKGNSVLYVDNLSFDNLITAVSNSSSELPIKFNLAQNYPNPFNPTTNISFDLPSKSFVSLKIFNVIGQEVATIVSEELSAGSYTKQWNAADLPSSVYFYRLQAGSFTETKKLILLK